MSRCAPVRTNSGCGGLYWPRYAVIADPSVVVSSNHRRQAGLRALWRREVVEHEALARALDYPVPSARETLATWWSYLSMGKPTATLAAPAEPVAYHRDSWWLRRRTRRCSATRRHHVAPRNLVEATKTLTIAISSYQRREASFGSSRRWTTKLGPPRRTGKGSTS